MSDSADNTEDESQGNETPGLLAGERLAAARREQQIAVSDIAKELHLDEYKVRALERNEFDVIGAPVFAKGHLRKYAQLVEISRDDVMADYYQLERSAGGPPALKPRKRPRQEISPGPWIAAAIVIFIAVAAYWWFSGGATVAPAASDVASLSTTTEEMDVANQPGVDEDSDGTQEPVSTIVEAAKPIEEPVAETALEAIEVVAPGSLRLRLTYSGDCWTEITDANGRRLFFDLGTEGRTVELSGEAPFNVLFGNAANIRLEVNGAPFDIAVVDDRGTARMTIAGP